MDNGSAFDSKGTFAFNNLQDYINNTAFQLAAGAADRELQTDAVAELWFFMQDDFRVTPALTVNIGLRYEMTTVPLGLFGATDAESLAALVPGPVGSDTNNWAPRVGVRLEPASGEQVPVGDGHTCSAAASASATTSCSTTCSR